MSMSKPKAPKAPEPPAQRPERKVDTEPKDIQLGTESGDDAVPLKIKGKRSLLRPTGSTGMSGSGGLQV